MLFRLPGKIRLIFVSLPDPEGYPNAQNGFFHFSRRVNAGFISPAANPVAEFNASMPGEIRGQNFRRQLAK